MKPQAPKNTKSLILQNKFVDLLRMELRVDELEYKALCKALRELAKEWRGLSQIDKELTSDLYVLSSIVRNMAVEVKPNDPAIRAKLEEMATEIDALVIDCLQPAR